MIFPWRLRWPYGIKNMKLFYEAIVRRTSSLITMIKSKMTNGCVAKRLVYGHIGTHRTTKRCMSCDNNGKPCTLTNENGNISSTKLIFVTSNFDDIVCLLLSSIWMAAANGVTVACAIRFHTKSHKQKSIRHSSMDIECAPTDNNDECHVNSHSVRSKWTWICVCMYLQHTIMNLWCHLMMCTFNEINMCRLEFSDGGSGCRHARAVESSHEHRVRIVIQFVCWRRKSKNKIFRIKIPLTSRIFMRLHPSIVLCETTIWRPPSTRWTTLPKNLRARAHTEKLNARHKVKT